MGDGASADLSMDPKCQPTLVAIVREHAQQRPEHRLFAFVDTDGRDRTGYLTYGELDEAARAIAATLIARGLSGSRALLLHPPGLEYIRAFFGCLYAGVVAVPAYPPDPSRLDKTLPRLRALAADAGPQAILTTQAIDGIFEALGEHAAEMLQPTRIATDTIPLGGAADWRDPAVTDASLAFLQYTSGSTAAPKGVRVTHKSLLHNLAAIADRFRVVPGETRLALWLPPYHDMGLIGGILETAYSGIQHFLMSPVRFIERPLRWLEMIGAHRCTVAGAPNFAYDLCVRRTSPADRARLDLSSWQIAFSGAERVRAETLERFIEAFEPHGFRRAAFAPLYGLAEATLMVSGLSEPGEWTVDRVDAEALGNDRRQPTAKDGRLVLGCGRAIAGHEIAIVEPESLRLRSDGEIGEIWLRGPSIADGYWNRASETEETFAARLADGNGPFLRTGDLGYLVDGELFVTGRRKDLVIIHGRNHYPDDLELTAERAHPILRPGHCAAFSVDVGDGERLVIVAEVQAAHVEAAKRRDRAEEVEASVRAAIARDHEVHLHDLVLVEPRSLPRTSSAKLQRQATARAYEQGLIDRLTPRASKPALPRDTSVQRFVRDQVAVALGVDSADVDVHRPLASLGIDSIGAIEVKSALQAHLGIDISFDVILGGSSIAEIVTRLRESTRTPTRAERTAIVIPKPPAPQPDRFTMRNASDARRVPGVPAFSLFYFASSAADSSEGRYQALLDGARFADRHGFEAVWTPERHLHPFGGLFPNPSVLGAAIAMITERIRIRAGSVVLPLHSPLRVAEEWAVVDNLSRGRVDLAFATGWNASDFILRPEGWAGRRDRFVESVETVRRLWRGEAVDFAGVDGGNVSARLHPAPLQPELPFWITVARSKESFEQAGTSGGNLLTNLLFFSIEELGERIAIYRDARRAAGFDPATGRVTLMLHTLVGESDAAVKATVRAPLTEYLESSIDLWSRESVDLKALSANERSDVVAFAFERYFERGGLFGSHARCISRVRELASLGVDEIACLVDFGVDDATTLRGFEHLRQVREALLASESDRDRSVSALAPLSFAQERMWFLQQIEPASGVYNDLLGLKLEGQLDVDALQRAIDAVVARHPILRTRFVTVDGVPHRATEPRAGVVLNWVELEHGATDEVVAQRAREEAKRPFDLAADPPLRATLFRRGEQDHLLILVVHHIATDATSARILFRELARHYGSRGLDGSNAAAAAVASPPDLSAESDDASAQLAWWRDRLRDAPAELSIVGDRERPAVPSRRGLRVPVRIAPTTARRLRELAVSEAGTPFMALLAAFQTLLHRYSARTDIVVGTPIEGRTSVDQRESIGCFTNTLAIRSDLSGDPSFRELVRRTRRDALEAYAHATIPFERVVQAVQPPRALGHHPIFQAMFVLQAPAPAPVEIAGVTFSPVVIDPGTAKFDLRLELAETDGGFDGYLEVDSDLFADATAERMAKHLATVIDNAAQAADTQLSRLPLGDETERAFLLAALTGESRSYSARGVATLVSAQATRTPDAIALSFENGSWTYAELEQAARGLAHRLREAGARPDALVALCADRSPELVAAQLAVWKLGAAFLPLAPHDPPDRRRHMIDDARPDLILAAANVVDALRAELPNGTTILAIDASPFGPAFGEANVPPTEENPDAAAYVLYTSGSTGTPKAVVVPQRGIVNRLLWSQDELALGVTDAVLQKTATTFDVSIWETFAPLIAGARLHVLPSGAEKDPAAIVQAVEQHAITVMHFVPSMLRAFLDRPDLSRCDRLRRVHSSGEPIATDLANRLFERVPNVDLINLYGPTEASVDVTWWRCRPGEARVPLGRPIANVHLYVVDERRSLAPLGVPGELCIGGVCLAREYLGRQDSTARAFVPDPFRRGERMYMTGDMVRATADGVLEYLGRADDQIKIRGMRVELGEIEAALRAHPEVKAAAAAIRDTSSGAQLVAWFVPRTPGAEPELRRFVARRLPEHMVPTAFVEVSAIPTTAAGKLDRRTLPDPRPIVRRTSTPTGVPATTVRWEIAAAFRDVLRIDHAAETESFFDLGGHSLLGAQLIARLKETLGVELPLRAIFEAPTAAALGELIARALDGKPLLDVSRTAESREHLEREAQLDDAIAPSGAPRAGPLREVLLTGATGFVGAFLLRDLLRIPGLRVSCLVRAPSRNAAFERIRQNLDAHDLWEDRFGERIVAIPGDLAHPNVGLAAEEWRALSDRVDAIYHNGAHVDHARMYRALRAANVGGTIELLRLATTGAPRPFHFVSTLSIFESPAYDRRHVVSERDRATDPLCHDSYAQTKWVAEMLALEAARRGLPVSVHRLGMCTGDTVHGAGGTTGIFARFLTGIIALGVAPEMDLDLWLVPVDYVSHALVQMSLGPFGSAPLITHLVGRQPTAYVDVIRAVKRAGHSLRIVPYAQWLSHVREHIGPASPLYPLTAFLTPDLLNLYGRAARPMIDSAITADHLAASGIVCPAVDDTRLAFYLDRWMRIGTIPHHPGDLQLAP